MNSDHDLLRCPFCGEEADADVFNDVWKVGCTVCPAEMEGARNEHSSKHFPDELQKTIDAWNARVKQWNS